MKRLLNLGAFSLITMVIYSQSSLTITSNEKAGGRNYFTGNEIKVREYIFPERIEHSFIDTVSNLLTVQLRGLSKNGKWLNNSGDMIQYDLSNGQIRWTKKLNYQQGNIEQFNNLIIQTVGNKSYSLNIDNGENEWEAKNKIYYVEPIMKIGIGYQYKTTTGYTNTLEGIDLLNGERIWKREINREYSWNDIFHLNDSILFIVAAGLHSVNLKNGSGWDYNTITGKKDYTETVLANTAGVVAGLLTGTFFTATGNNLVRDVVSNVLIDSSNLYFASRERLVRLTCDGQIIWSSPLPGDFTSKSAIFIRDSLIYLVNKGFAFMGYRQLDFGTPFLAAFKLKSGEQVFMNPISLKKDPVRSFEILKDTVYAIFKNRVSKFSMRDGSLISEHIFNIDTTGELMYFVGKQAYVKSDSLYYCLPLSDSTRHYLFTKSNKALITNYKFEVLDQVDYNQIYIYYLKTSDYKFLVNGNETTIIDNKNKKAAVINATGNSLLLGKKLFDIQEKSFVEIDLSDLLN